MNSNVISFYKEHIQHHASWAWGNLRTILVFQGDKFNAALIFNFPQSLTHLSIMTPEQLEATEEISTYICF